MLYKKKKWMVFIFILPFVFFAGVFLIYPFVSNCINMFYLFQRSTTPLSQAEFVGWQNFAELFADPLFGLSIGNTFIMIAFVIVFQMGLALVLALCVNGIKKLSGLYRVLFFVPIVLSGTLIGTMFFMFQYPSNGLFTKLAEAFGINRSYIDPSNGQTYYYTWIDGNNWFGSLMYCLVPIIWQYVGFYFVILLTGLSNISDDIMEAAALDGASTMQQIRYVTLPMLWNVFRTCMVLSITGALKVFDVPYVMASGGGPNGVVYFMGTYNNFLFSSGTNPNHAGYTRLGECAIYSVILVLTGIIVSQISNAVIRENKDI